MKTKVISIIVMTAIVLFGGIYVYRNAINDTIPNVFVNKKHIVSYQSSVKTALPSFNNSKRGNITNRSSHNTTAYNSQAFISSRLSSAQYNNKKGKTGVINGSVSGNYLNSSVGNYKNTSDAAHNFGSALLSPIRINKGDSNLALASNVKDKTGLFSEVQLTTDETNDPMFGPTLPPPEGTPIGSGVWFLLGLITVYGAFKKRRI